MSKKKSTTTTTGLDPASQRYVDEQRRLAQNASNVALAGPGGGSRGGMFSDMLRGVGTPPVSGMPGGPPGAAGGDPNSWFLGPQTQSVADQVSPFMNPYISNVVDATRGEFDHLRAGARTGTAQQATLSGAYGGSRHGVAEGVRMGELDRAQTSTVADLMNRGYSQALGTGLEYADRQRQYEQERRMEPLFRQQQAMQFMNFGMGPTGSVGTTSEQGNFWSGAGDFLKTAGGLGMAYMGARGAGGGGGAPGGGYSATPAANPYGGYPWAQPQYRPDYMPGRPA